MSRETDLINEAIKYLSASEALEERYKSNIGLLREKLVFAGSSRFRIGLIGVTSSGKSTLVNAVLGEELIFTDVKPSSNIKVCCYGGKTRKGVVYFEDGRRPLRLNGSALTREALRGYGVEENNQENRKRVEQIDVYSPRFAFPEEFMLIDSPGLDAFGLERHDRFTREMLLPSLDMCVFVTTAKSNSDDTMREILESAAEYKKPIVIVQNMIDSVEASPNGKLSAEEVRRVHRSRAERVAKRAGLDPGMTRIVQLSARKILSESVKSRPNRRETARWGFGAFIDAVTELYEKVRPSIEYDRLDGIRADIRRIIDEGRTDLEKHGENDLVEKRFRFEDTSEQLEAVFRSSLTEISGAINAMRGVGSGKQAETIRRLLRSKRFSTEKLKSLKSAVESCEETVIRSASRCHYAIQRAAKELSISIGDLAAFSALHIAGSPALVKVKRKDRSSFGGRLTGFFRKIFRSAEKDARTDHDETRRRAAEYLRTVYNAYSDTISGWLKTAERKLDIIAARIDSEREAYNARLNDRIAAAEKERLIESLNALLEKIPEREIPADGGEKPAEAERGKEPVTERTEISAAAFYTYLLARETAREIHGAVIGSVLERFPRAGDHIVAAWDIFSAEKFLNRSFRSDITAEELEQSRGKALKKGKLTVLMYPDAGLLSSLEFRGRKNLFILVNALQTGQAENQISGSGIKALTDPKCSVFAVIQNFAEVINSGETGRTVRLVPEMLRRISLGCSPFLLINDPNPIYSAAAAEAQLSAGLNFQDEVSVRSRVIGAMKMFGGAEAEKRCEEIIRAVFDYRKGAERFYEQRH